MSDTSSQLLYFYNRHPISLDIIVTKLRASRGHLDDLRPEELYAHDQDHYGGLTATDELARQARIGPGTAVADFCAGLGGTVRYLAHKYGANVTGVEFTPVRAAGAQELTRLVGLQEVARIVEGNVMDAPLPDASVDAVVSQESFCHVPDVKRALAEARRILKAGGRLAFTDWVANEPLAPADAQLMWDGMAIQPLRSIADYRRLVENVGFGVLSVTDLTEEWRPILEERLAMYQRLREEARQSGAPTGHDAFHESYIRFVDLIQQRKLGGVRIVAST
ncbi:class I SAM-dependent methyltransferase [Bradyrhizobium sp. 199]|uniref:class I SAM-dependent methyltransferase n=1 Tax=Bradyrhizobium sp. 199 TaxID=2782664 RepID=UPI001FFA98DB|nr:class I SAM-dependent methyltransferase [Bradyrhizobium sp. 199]MCK1360539.1 methyltransferase domain-containing protein [Bradyrhizobium sp. 199]